MSIPVLGLGTWGMGGRSSPDYTNDDEEIEAIRYALDLGMTHIDTAEYYGGGHAEELVGKAIQGYRREDVFITTKVWRTNLEYDDLISSMKGSLKRLDLDYVDLYLIHWPNPEVPLEETMNALERCSEEGWTRLIGVSNFSKELMREAQSYLREARLIADQVEYSLMEQSPRTELLSYLKDVNSTLIAYRPIARGELAKPGYDALDDVAERYDKTQAQIALNWLKSQENVIAIPKSSDKAHIREITGSVGWSLSEDDRTKLENYFK
ncbi:MAG: aldo/keto reductase [Candidatus Bathyarchaeia archaeon]